MDYSDYNLKRGNPQCYRLDSRRLRHRFSEEGGAEGEGLEVGFLEKGVDGFPDGEFGFNVFGKQKQLIKLKK
jgi:hypothetical protein